MARYCKTCSIWTTVPRFPRIMSTPLRLTHRARPLRSFLVTPTSTRAFRASAARHDFHFDTHHFVQRLEREGLNRQQAEGIMSAMAEVIDESIRNMTSNMVTKADQEKVCARSAGGRRRRRLTRHHSTNIPNKLILHSLNRNCS